MPTRAPAPERAVVLSMGGSVLLTGHNDRQYLEDLATLLREVGRKIPLVVTTGGGRTAREYIHLGRELGLTEVELDEIGIDVTRLHARLLAARIGPPTPAHPPTTVALAVHELQRGSPVILGGTEPGHTTDGVGALVAARLRASRFINATDVNGIYEHDPRTNPRARRIAKSSWVDFRRRVQMSTTGEAGQNFLFDRLGADILWRAGIPLLVVDGRNLANLEAAIRGHPFDGSRVE
ncbi:MAG: UMP kinase [Thermoplasmata archaeon]